MPTLLIALIPLAVTTGLLGYSLLVPERLGFLLGWGGYYFMVALVLAIVYSLFTIAPPPGEIIRFVRRNLVGFISSAVLVLVVLLTIKPELRIFSDEALIAGVSKSMLYEKSTWVAVEGKWYYDSFFPTLKELDKRPFLFPFLGHLLHLVSGYRPENLIALNCFFLFSLLATVFLVVNRHLGAVCAVAAQLLVLAQPIVGLSATCGGLELFAALTLVWALLAAARYLDEQSPENLLLLWAASLALMHSRYESVLSVGIIWGALALFKKLRRRDLERHLFLYAATPLFGLPILWQRWFRFNAQEAPPGVAPFSLEHMWEHLGVYLQSQLHLFSDELPYGSLIVLLGLAAGVLVIAELASGKKAFKKTSTLQAFAMSVACFVVYMGVMLSFHFADYTHPAAARYFLIPSLAVSFLPFLALYFHPLARRFWAGAAAFGLFAFYYPIAMMPITMHSLYETREVAFVQQFLNGLPKKNILLITSDSEIYTMREFGAVDFKSANRDHAELFMQSAHHLFQDVYVVQHVRYADEKPVPEETLLPGFETQTLSELESSEVHYVRISKIVKLPTSSPRDLGSAH